MNEYNQAIADVIALLDDDIKYTDALRLRKNISPSEDARMVEQVRKMIVLKARIGEMRKGLNAGYLLSPEFHGEDIEYDQR